MLARSALPVPLCCAAPAARRSLSETTPRMVAHLVNFLLERELSFTITTERKMVLDVKKEKSSCRLGPDIFFHAGGNPRSNVVRRCCCRSVLNIDFVKNSVSESHRQVKLDGLRRSNPVWKKRTLSARRKRSPKFQNLEAGFEPISPLSR